MNEGKYVLLTTLAGQPVIESRRTGQAIPNDEPIFILRARDNHALAALQAYLEYCGDAGCSPEHIDGICQAITRFMDFAQVHNARMKQPGE